MINPSTHRRCSVSVSRGFTLVEMLVAVALVMLLMLMFAQVFQIAGDSIGRMRGMAENDQRARSLQNIIKADLDKRTFRFVFPFAADEDTGAPDEKMSDRQGFVYISENNPNDDVDDVLHFTIGSNITIRNADTTSFFGQALNLANPANAKYPSPNMDFINQPDMDDLQYEPNNTGSSTMAEVVYFVRNGNLYRRQLLLRDQVLGNDPQPTDGFKRHIFDSGAATASPLYPSGVPNSTTFWGDYDYSAAYSTNNAGLPTGARFNGVSSLDNSTGSSIAAIAYPPNRYGFSPFINGSSAPYQAGIPKEFISNSGSNRDNINQFIGRFTLEEVSHPNFQYPQGYSIDPAGSVTNLIPTDNTANLTLNTGTDYHINGPIDFGANSTTPPPSNRRGEDLLLSNVHAFNVQLWDETIQGFVDIGDDYTRDYTLKPDPLPTPPKAKTRINDWYGPRFTSESLPTVANAIYDTWHPAIELDGTAGYDNPPFLPLRVQPGDPSPTRSPEIWNSFPTPSYSVGNIVFPTSANLMRGRLLHYRCVQVTTGTPGTTEPVWPKAAGLTVNDGGVTWLSVDNRKPLRAIRIQVRFLDINSQQLRQLTIVQSLVD